MGQIPLLGILRMPKYWLPRLGKIAHLGVAQKPDNLLSKYAPAAKHDNGPERSIGINTITQALDCGAVLRLLERRLVPSRSTVIIPFDDHVIFVSLFNCAEFSSRLSGGPQPSMRSPLVTYQ